MHRLFQVVALLAGVAAGSGGAIAASLSTPEVDGYNVRVGTQIFGPKYHFTTNTSLVEAARGILDMGSDVLKFYMGRGFFSQYGATLPSSITNLASMARLEPSCRTVLDLPFRHYAIWNYCFAATGDAWWSNGFPPSEQQAEYNEFYAFAQYLLTNYNNSGKSFYLGHWEGDWYLLAGYNPATNPNPTAIQGMIDWLNTRQQAIDDARRTTPHTNVAVYVYTEVNRVRDAMVNPPESSQRLVNMVLPYVTNIDCVSWSSYDGMNLSQADLYATLDYIQAHLPTNKSAVFPGQRVFVGEYGWGGSLSSAAQEAPSRSYIQKLLGWGVRFILFWEFYDNEGKAFWLIDSSGNKTPCYFLHQRFLNAARLRIAQFRESNGRLPTEDEFSSLTTPLLNNLLPEPANFSVRNLLLTAMTGTNAMVDGTVAPGVYGTDPGTVRVFWGTQDGGTVRAAWERSATLGLCTNFNPQKFTADLPDLVPGTNYFFRFYATNSAGEVWAPASTPFSTAAFPAEAYGSSLRITLSGYNGSEILPNFPVLVSLGTNLPGFSYRQFASASGGDLRFTDASGTQLLCHEIDEWNTNGISSVWVRMSVLSGTNDRIWAFWGNPAAATPPASSTNGLVWAQDFELVWHLKETAFPYNDSTLKHPALRGIAPSGTTAGRIGRGCSFDGQTQFLGAGIVNLGDQFTISAWFKPHATSTNIQTIWANKAAGANNPGFGLFANSWQTGDQRLWLETGNGTDSAQASTAANLVTRAQWHHIAAVVDRANATATLFLDGQDCTGAAVVHNDFANVARLCLGTFTNAAWFAKGNMDEVRVETQCRSADWIRASYMTASPLLAFATYSAVSRAAPLLSLSVGGNALRFTWPGAGLAFSLYTATILAPTAVWQAVTNQAVLVGDQWQLDLQAGPGPARFYRLQSF